MALINKFVTWRMKKRAHQMELFIKYPLEVQAELLRKLVSTSQNTVTGKKAQFKDVRNYQDFKSSLPTVSYEDIEEDILSVKDGAQNLFWPTEIKWFAKSSGTTNSKSKFIPVSKEAIEECHFKGGKDMLSIYFHHNPETRIYSGKGLLLGGSKQINQISNESFYGDLSAILISNLPFWVAIKRMPDMDTMLMEEWEEKLEIMSTQTIGKNITHVAGVPSWTMVLFKKILEKTGAQNIHEVWPNLELFMHGGVSFEPYREQYKRLLPSPKTHYLETYNASEGFFGIQYQPDSPDMLLMLDYGIFYEFIPMSEIDNANPSIIDLSEVMIGVNYAMVISTNSGLWRYKLGDTIMFTSTSPYLFRITGRTKHFINAFGEELIIQNADLAIRYACEKTNAQFREYTAAPYFMDENNTGGHEWIIEFDLAPSDLGEFTQFLDDKLKELNSDYEAKRHKGMVLQFPKIKIGNPGVFQEWLKRNNKLGGQNKIPRLSNNRIFLEQILEIDKIKG